jgi:hypothetical protein
MEGSQKEAFHRITAQPLDAMTGNAAVAVSFSR